MAGVVLKGVNKVFPNGFHAVHDQDLEIEDGEFMVLVGPSGCAKSTTLNMIAGLEDITRGEIWIGDRLVNDLAPKDRNIAMVFQSYALYPHMTVAQNMAFGLKLRKYSKEEIEQRVREAADILELGDLLDRKPKALSGGQRQRVAVGRAIVRKPAVFLFDEPLSNLDAKLRVHMRVELKQLHHTLGTTIIYVTHDQVEAMTMGDRICVLKDGRIQQVDTPLTLYHEPVNKFVAGFIGSPAMNLFEVDVVESGGLAVDVPQGGILALPADKAAKLSGLAGKKAWLGLRPEHVTVDVNGDGSGEGFQSRVAVVEMMGNEVFAYFALGREEFVARLEADARVKAGDTRRFVFAMDQCHVFDHETGKNLTL